MAKSTDETLQKKELSVLNPKPTFATLSCTTASQCSTSASLPAASVPLPSASATLPSTSAPLVSTTILSPASIESVFYSAALFPTTATFSSFSTTVTTFSNTTSTTFTFSTPSSTTHTFPKFISATTSFTSPNPAATTFTFSNPTTTTFTFPNPTSTTFTFSTPSSTTPIFPKFISTTTRFTSPYPTTTTFTFSNPTTTIFTSPNPTTTRFRFSNPTSTRFTVPNPTTTTSTVPNPTTTTSTFSNFFGTTFEAPNLPTTSFTFPVETSELLDTFRTVFDKKIQGLESKLKDFQKIHFPSCIDASTQTKEELHVDKLLHGLKEMLLNSKHSDFTLNVKGKEFRVHKIILEAHSPVFAAMMEHDTKEKATGTVNIKDYEPLTLTLFLDFLYTGRVENLNSDNVLELYIVADKYQVTELSKLCIEYMKNNISVENFCDIMSLSLRHHVMELMQVATDFFLENSTTIAITVKWQTFLEENPVAANELFLKALNLKKD